MNKILLAVAILLLTPSVFATKVITIDYEGAMSTGGNTTSSGGCNTVRCNPAPTCCYSIKVTVPDSYPNVVPEGNQPPDVLIELSVLGQIVASGTLISYNNQPVPGESILTRDHIYVIIP